MGIHKSLRLRGKLVRHRNVLTRSERLAILQKDDKWNEEKDSVFGLPKVKHILIRVKKPTKKAEAEGAVPAEGAAPATAEATPPAAGAKKDKGKSEKKK